MCETLRPELQEANESVIKALKDVISFYSENYSGKKMFYLPKFQTINLDILVNDPDLRAFFMQKLMEKAIGPYMVFVARLLEVLKSSTELPKLFTKEAYKYLDQYGHVYLTIELSKAAFLSGGWLMKVQKWTFEENVVTSQKKWDELKTVSTTEVFSLQDAAIIQLKAMEEAFNFTCLSIDLDLETGKIG